MDDEKIQKTIEFILDNQAQFTADIQELKELHKQSEKRINVLERATVNLYNEVTETSKNVNRVSEKVDLMSDKVDKLVDLQKETDDRLNVVIVMFEKFLGNQNGGSK